MITKLIAAFAVTLSLLGSAVAAPACPPGSTCNAIENYITNAPGGAASPPYNSNQKIPVAPGPSNKTLQQVPATILNDCTNPGGKGVPTPPNDPNKVLNGQCQWVTGGSPTPPTTPDCLLITGSTSDCLLWTGTTNDDALLWH